MSKPLEQRDQFGIQVHLAKLETNRQFHGAKERATKWDPAPCPPEWTGNRR